MVNKRLLLLSAILALAVGALAYFLFVVHAPEAQRTASDSPASAAAPAPRFAAAPLPEPAADETDLCGYGRVKESDLENFRDQSAKDADKVLDGLKKKLAASKDPRQAALGLYMLGSKEALVKLASASRDPQVYALAFLSCGYTGGGACDLLSAQQWAEMDSDNGVPWLLVASAARPRFVPQGDPERNVAMYQAVVRAIREPDPKYRENESVRSDCDALAAFDRWAAEYSTLGDRGMVEKLIEETRKANAVHGDRAVP